MLYWNIIGIVNTFQNKRHACLSISKQFFIVFVDVHLNRALKNKKTHLI